MTIYKHSRSGFFFASALAVSLCAGNAMAATEIKLGWTTSDSELDPYAIAARYFAEELEKAAPGEFDVSFFPNHQLGNDTEMLEGLQFGTMDAGVITGTQVGQLDTAFQLNDLPFLYADSAQAHAVLDGAVGVELLKRLESQGIKGLGFAEAGFRQTINNKKPVTKPDDFQGIKLRVQPSDLFIDSFRAIGANPTPMAWSDVFTAVQQGTVDGLEIPLAVIYANKYPEVTKYLSLTNHTYNALAVLMSKDVFDRLSEDQQKAVQDSSRKAIDRQRKKVASNEEEVLQRIKDAGMQVNEISNVELFRSKVASVYDEYSEAIGPDLLNKALDQVSK
ncbi:C4-dicarboxylate transport system (C4-dicarboxylate-binding protein) [Marinobacter sp. ELB17]|nr:C4-dicarboxylate transport system (C4-dicarboxylate-binding protein) [Marinobacter sp. ELB17]